MINTIDLVNSKQMSDEHGDYMERLYANILEDMLACTKSRVCAYMKGKNMNRENENKIVVFDMGNLEILKLL